MATKTKNKKGEFTNHQNGKKPIQVKEPEEAEILEVNARELFPQSTQIVPIKEFDRPLVNLDEAMKAWEQYQDLINALVKTKDITVFRNKKTGEEVKKAKKSGINKIAKFFGYTCEIVRAYSERLIGPQGGKVLIWRVWAKAIAPNGRFRVAGAACSSAERMFAHLEHDVYATAETRAKKRAIEELAGMGELELMEEEEKPKTSRKAPEKEPEEKITYEEYEANGKKYVRAIKNGQVIREGIDPDEWKPVFKLRPAQYGGGAPSSPNMAASDKQLEVIADKIKKTGIAPEDVVFILNNRIDGKPREVMLIDFNKGDAHDVIEAIKRKKIKIVKKKDGKIEAMIG